MTEKMRKIKRTLFSALTIAVTGANAQTIAECSEPEGYAYYHYSGIVRKDQAGFHKDKISGGVTKIEKLANGDYDLHFVDSRRIIISTKQDGGNVFLLRRSEKDATFLTIYPGKTIEIYSIWIDKENNSKFSVLQSKGGGILPIPKSSVMVGDCQFLDLDLIQ